MPHHYWHKRYREAFAKAEQTHDAALHDIYTELADHYLAMELFVDEADDADGAERGSRASNGRGRP